MHNQFDLCTFSFIYAQFYFLFFIAIISKVSIHTGVAAILKCWHASDENAVARRSVQVWGTKDEFEELGTDGVTSENDIDRYE